MRKEEAAAMFEMEEEPFIRACAAADWFLAPGEEECSTMRAALQEAVLRLPDELAELTGALRVSLKKGDVERREFLTSMVYDRLVLRDVVEDLQEEKPGFVDVEMTAAIERFDAALDEVDPLLHSEVDQLGEELRQQRLRMGARPGKSGRRWWQPRV